MVQAAAGSSGPMALLGMPPYHRQTHGFSRGPGVDSADFACSFCVCSATQPLPCRRASPVPWGRGQCGSPLNSPCGKEAPNAKHVKPMGHPATPTPHPPCQPCSSSTYPFSNTQLEGLLPCSSLSPDTEDFQSWWPERSPARLHSEDGKKLH